MDRKAFFNAIREDLGSFEQSQVDGFTFLLNFAEKENEELSYLAYILATAWWETANTMQPVREAFWCSEGWRKRNLRYYPYYGRGYVQLTWEKNYRKATLYFQNVLGIDIDFVKHPELVMHPKHAAIILFRGMEAGWFTGKDLDDYIDLIDEPDEDDEREYVAARRIVNGTDKDDEIALIALSMENALRSAGYGSKGDIPKETHEASQRSSQGGFWHLLKSLLLVLTQRNGGGA